MFGATPPGTPFGGDWAATRFAATSCTKRLVAVSAAASFDAQAIGSGV
jgi:hypothetical protein